MDIEAENISKFSLANYGNQFRRNIDGKIFHAC